jgi:hypothetical protein
MKGPTLAGVKMAGPSNPEDEQPGDQPGKAQLLRGHSGPSESDAGQYQTREHQRSGSPSVGKGTRTGGQKWSAHTGQRQHQAGGYHSAAEAVMEEQYERHRGANY